MRFWLSALVAIAALPVGAHHPFTPFYDGSTLASISGPIVGFAPSTRMSC